MDAITESGGAALIAGSALVLGACSASQGSPSSDDGGGTQVDVTLQEWAVVIGQDSAPAGDVTFSITNDGPDDIHEFVIFKTDLAPGDLPVDDRGGSMRRAVGIEVVDEVEDIEVGATADLSVTLEAGSYVLVCNIYDEDETEAHYSMGMRAAFTVP